MIKIMTFLLANTLVSQTVELTPTPPPEDKA